MKRFNALRHDQFPALQRCKPPRSESHSWSSSHYRTDVYGQLVVFSGGRSQAHRLCSNSRQHHVQYVTVPCDRLEASNKSLRCLKSIRMTHICLMCGSNRMCSMSLCNIPGRQATAFPSPNKRQCQFCETRGTFRYTAW